MNLSKSALAILVLATSATGQEPVASLESLVGARGTVVDGLATRGYTHHHTDKSADSSHSYWREDSSGRCVAARVTDGRVASIVYSDGDCVAREPRLEAGFFRTVCGVIRGGETFRYRCQAKDETVGGKRLTILRFPDQEMTFSWLDDDSVTIERAGLVPVQAKHATSEGETDVVTNEMTYFYISDRGMAESEVRNFRD